MFKSKQPQPQQQEYSSSDEEIADAIGSEDQMDPKQQEEHILTMYKPMRTEDMKRPQSIRVHMEIVGSPHELETNAAHALWQIDRSLHDQFRENFAIHHRDQAKGEDLAGSPNRIIPLGLRIFSHQNTFPFAVGIRIPGILDKHLAKKEGFAWVVGAKPQALGQPMDVFDPKHIVNKYQYENSIICSSADLDRDLVHTDKGRTKIAVGSFPHARLMEHIHNRSFTREEMTAMNASHIMNPGQDQDVEVPRSVGEMLENEIRPFVEDSSKGMVDATNWVASFHRADGQKNWNSPRQLVGTMVTGKSVNASKINADILHVNAVCSVDAEIFFKTA